MTTGTISTMGPEGDTKLMWDSADPDQVAAAEAHFNALARPRSKGGKGYLAYKAQGTEGARGEQIRTFDPSAERIIMVPQSAGG